MKVREELKAKPSILKNLKIYIGELAQSAMPSERSKGTSSLTSEKFSSLKRNDPKIKELVGADSLPSFGSIKQLQYNVVHNFQDIDLSAHSSKQIRKPTLMVMNLNQADWNDFSQAEVKIFRPVDL